MSQNTDFDMDQNTGSEMEQHLTPAVDQNVGTVIEQNTNTVAEQNLSTDMKIDTITALEQNISTTAERNTSTIAELNTSIATEQNISTAMEIDTITAMEHNTSTIVEQDISTVMETDSNNPMEFNTNIVMETDPSTLVEQDISINPENVSSLIRTESKSDSSSAQVGRLYPATGIPVNNRDVSPFVLNSDGYGDRARGHDDPASGGRSRLHGGHERDVSHAGHRSADVESHVESDDGSFAVTPARYDTDQRRRELALFNAQGSSAPQESHIDERSFVWTWPTSAPISSSSGEYTGFPLVNIPVNAKWNMLDEFKPHGRLRKSIMDLTPELKTYICEELIDEDGDITDLLTACHIKILHLYAVQLLLKEPAEYKFVPFLRTMVWRSDHANKVREIQIDPRREDWKTIVTSDQLGFVVQHIFDKCPPDQQAYWFNGIQNPATCAGTMGAFLLVHLPNLKIAATSSLHHSVVEASVGHLCCRPKGYPTPSPLTRSALLPMFMKLQELYIYGSTPISWDNLALLLHLPSIKSLTVTVSKDTVWTSIPSLRPNNDLSLLPHASVPLVALQIGNMGLTLDEVIAILAAIKEDSLQTLCLLNFCLGSVGNLDFSLPSANINFTRLSTALEPFKKSLSQLSIAGTKISLVADMYAPIGDLRGFNNLKEIQMDAAVFSSPSNIVLLQDFLPSGIQTIKIGAIGPRHHLHLSRGAGQLSTIVWNRAILPDLLTLSLGYYGQEDSSSEDDNGGPTGLGEGDETDLPFSPFRDEVREVFEGVGVGLLTFLNPVEMSLFGFWGREGFLSG